MSKSFIPDTDDGLLSWANNVSTLLSADPTTYGITMPIAANYSSFLASYAAALTNAQAPQSRGPATILVKNEARQDLVTNSRQVARMVNGFIGTTNEMRQNLGFTVRKTPAPVPAPSARPGVDIVSAFNRRVTIHIHDSASSSKRGKPAGCVTAYVYTFVGPTYSSDPSTWLFNGAVNKSTYEIAFPDSVASGAQVWICVAWVNLKGETGPTSVPISTNIQGGGMSMAA